MLHLKELKNLNVYDFHKLSPQTYDVRGAENEGVGGKKNE
jgi:hypothetical protein